MKKTVFLTVLAALLLVGFNTYGQDLEAKKGSNGKYGYVDSKTGKEVIPFKYDYAEPFSEGMAKVKLNYKYGYIDITGKEVIPCKYDFIYEFHEGLAEVKLNNKYGYIDKTGREVAPCKYDIAIRFSDVIKVKLNGKYGCIDETGREVVPCKYDFIYDFSDGMAKVSLDDDNYGYIDKTGKMVIPCKYGSREADRQMRIYKKSFFSNFAKDYVEKKINEWQKKGEFEKTVDYQQRVTETARKEMVQKFTKEAEQEFIAEKGKTVKLSLGQYDADNETYLITSDISSGNMLVHVPASKAQAFKNSWESIKYTPQFGIENDRIAIAAIDFKLPNGETYQYSNQASLNYAVAQIDYKFDPININVAPSTTAPKGNQTIGTVNLSVGKSDVAVNIPVTNAKNDKTFAVIIANENYRRESQVIFAKNDGETFKKYCVQTLGLPEKNIHYTADATLNEIRGEVNWISQVASAFKGEASIIFYYAGHGIPDENSKTAYLLPVDGYGSDVQTGYKLDDLYQTMGKMPAKNITILMDACFSGAQRSSDGDMLASARGVAVKVVQGAPVGNMVVFSAAQGDETAYPYKEKGHGLFTYFLLKKLQESKGDVTLGELSDYITTNVGQKAMVENNKEQTPTVTPSAAIGDKWKGLKLK